MPHQSVGDAQGDTGWQGRGWGGSFRWEIVTPREFPLLMTSMHARYGARPKLRPQAGACSDGDAKVGGRVPRCL